MITLFRTSGEKTHVRCQSSTSLKDVQSLLHQECALVASGQFFLDPHSTPFAAARASVCGTRKENTISELALSQTVSCYMTGKNHKERDSNNALLQRQRRHDEFRNTSGRSVSEIQSKLTLPKNTALVAGGRLVMESTIEGHSWPIPALWLKLRLE